MSSHRFKAREAAAAQEADEQDLREIREAEFAFYFLFLIVSRPSYIHTPGRERDRRRKAALFANVLDRLVDVCHESHTLDFCSPLQPRRVCDQAHQARVKLFCVVWKVTHTQASALMPWAPWAPRCRGI